MTFKLEPGHCWISGKPIAEIQKVYPRDHPLAGHVAVVGKLLPEATKITMLLMDGKQCEIRVHKDHVAEIDLNDIWHSLIDAEWHNYTHRQFLPHYNAEQAAKAHENQIRLLQPPVAILDIQHSDDIRVTL